VVSGSCASSAVMRFQLGRPFGDVSGKDVAGAGLIRGRIGPLLTGCSSGWTGATPITNSASSTPPAGWFIRASTPTTSRGQTPSRIGWANTGQSRDRDRTLGRSAGGIPAQQGHRLFCVSPKMSARARERYRLAPTKSDAFDAFVLADSLRHEHRHWRSLAVPSALLAQLRAVTRDRERLIFYQRDVENQLRAIVLAYHPGVQHLARLPDTGPGRPGRRCAHGSVLHPAWLLRPDTTRTAG